MSKMNEVISVLSQKYAVGLILALLRRGPVNKTELKDIVSNPYKLTDLIAMFVRDGLVKTKVVRDGKSAIRVSLSAKGERIAIGLLRLIEEEYGEHG